MHTQLFITIVRKQRIARIVIAKHPIQKNLFHKHSLSQMHSFTKKLDSRSITHILAIQMPIRINASTGLVSWRKIRILWHVNSCSIQLRHVKRCAKK